MWSLRVRVAFATRGKLDLIDRADIEGAGVVDRVDEAHAGQRRSEGSVTLSDPQPAIATAATKSATRRERRISSTPEKG